MALIYFLTSFRNKLYFSVFYSLLISMKVLCKELINIRPSSWKLSWVKWVFLFWVNNSLHLWLNHRRMFHRYRSILYLWWDFLEWFWQSSPSPIFICGRYCLKSWWMVSYSKQYRQTAQYFYRKDSHRKSFPSYVLKSIYFLLWPCKSRIS